MGIKQIAVNKKAYHDYFIYERYEAGLVLQGTEIKSLRKGKAQFKDAYISFVQDEAYLKGMHIALYTEGNRFNHEETRDRKLLLHRHEIRRLYGKTKTAGYTVIPLKLYLKNGYAKMEIALAKGKALYDRREDAKIKAMKREAAKAMKY